METVVTSICDEFPERLRKNHRHVLSLCSLIFYACGVPLCTQVSFVFKFLFFFIINNLLNNQTSLYNSKIYKKKYNLKIIFLLYVHSNLMLYGTLCIYSPKMA